MNFLWTGLGAAAFLAGCMSAPSSLGSGAPTTHMDGGDARTVVDTGFTCAPPPDAGDGTMDFTATKFDPAGGCLTGAPVAVPACGCFGSIGKDTSTWCFAAPDGTAYFTSSPDQCDLQIAPGWYATQTFGPSPGITPNAAQAKACADVAAASTAMATYDRKGPPTCGAADAGCVTPQANEPCTLCEGNWYCAGKAPQRDCPGGADGGIGACDDDGGACFACNLDGVAGSGCNCVAEDGGTADAGRIWSCLSEEVACSR
jgi:hypothetical protein